jgi:hypothetical protein
MVDFGLLNGKPKVTLIQRFDGSVFLLRLEGKKFEFKIGAPLQETQAKAAKLGWVIGVEHLHSEKMTRVY